MTRVPTLAAIKAAELRLLQSKRNVRQSVDRTGSALRKALVRPSTLVFLAVASGISTYVVSARRCPSIESADSAVKPPRRSFVRTLVSAYGVRVLNFALQHGAAAWKSSGSHVDADTPSTSTTGNTPI